MGVRLQPPQLDALDKWISQQPSAMTRPDALRAMLQITIELGLKAKAPIRPIRSKPNKFRAAELAAKAIGGMVDPSAPPEERAQRRRRLTKGPTEFREDRVDLPKKQGK